MSFQLVSYPLLVKHIEASLKTEVEHHRQNSQNLAAAIQNLPEERRIQAQYLLTVVECLKASDKSPEDKARVLNAAAYYVHAKIYSTYKYLLSPERSTLYNSLTTSLNLNAENEPDSSDLLDLYEPLQHFMQAHVYKGADPRKGYLGADKQPFSSDRIEGYDVAADLKRLINIIAKLRKGFIKTAKPEGTAASSWGFYSQSSAGTEPNNPKKEEQMAGANLSLS